MFEVPVTGKNHRNAVFIGSVGRTAPGSTATGTTATLSVRTVLSDTAAAHGVLEAPTLAAEAVPALAAAMADISAAMPATSPAQSVAEPHGGTREAPPRHGGASLRKASLTAPAEARADFTARPAASIATAEGSSSAPVAPTASLLAPAPEPLEEPLAPDAVRGTVVHKVLEELFDLPAPERTPAARRLVAYRSRGPHRACPRPRRVPAAACTAPARPHVRGERGRTVGCARSHDAPLLPHAGPWRARCRR